jgi:hypothetical protein
MQRNRGVFLTRSTLGWSNPVMPENSPLPVGATAPLFELRRSFHENVALGDLLERGPVAVVFYVFDFGDI